MIKIFSKQIDGLGISPSGEETLKCRKKDNQGQAGLGSEHPDRVVSAHCREG